MKEVGAWDNPERKQAHDQATSLSLTAKTVAATNLRGTNIMESRLKKSLNAGGRKDRASEDANRQPCRISSFLRRNVARCGAEEWTQSALPKLPDMDGWHLCWLSTTNSYDSIDKRMRLGYVPVKSDELPGYEDYRVKSGEHVGYISCNEMLLFKLPMDIYQEVMAYHHHEKTS
jgi:hypothetical protein